MFKNLATLEEAWQEGRAILNFSGQAAKHATFQQEWQQEFVTGVPVGQCVPNSNTTAPPDSKVVHSITGDP